jgi:class 3 adenylate cyclase
VAIEHGFIIFTDIKGFSKLTEENYPVFDEIYQDISNIFQKDLQSENIISFNTWGDAIVLVTKDKNVINNLLRLREYFIKHEYTRKPNFQKRNIEELKIRIGCHFGEFYSFINQFTKKPDFVGTDINLAARIEPSTRPNEVFVTKEFKNQYKKFEGVRFDKLGEIELAKNFGSRKIYVLRKADEEKQVIDHLEKQNLINELPDIKPLSKEQKSKIKKKYLYKSKSELKKIIKKYKIKQSSSEELFLIASVCKDLGYYDEALDVVEKLKSFAIDLKNIQVYPYRSNFELLKIEANSLTRLNKYQKASEIVYNLWKSGKQDSDTLSMLAAQYKRQACIDSNNQFIKNYNKELLIRSLNLYLEAFRRGFVNEDAYYPAINAAYIANVIGSEYAQYNTQLTNYIRIEWRNSDYQDWWRDSTVAQAYILQGNYKEAKREFKKIFEINSAIPIFEFDSTIQQLEFCKFYEYNQNNKKEIEKIINQINKAKEDAVNFK